MDAKKLTAKQQRFVEEYLVDLNATQAAIRAGYSKHTAAEIGAENLTKPKIAEALAQAQNARSARTEITADAVVRELGRIALLDIRGFYLPDGKLKAPHELSDEQGAALASLETLEEFEGRGEDRRQVGCVQKVKFWPKVEALRLLAQHLGMLVERHEHSGPGGKPIQSQDVPPDLSALTIEELETLERLHAKVAGRPGGTGPAPAP
jgi:phage terminase small subunit